jgi:hypothetical protein
MMRHCFNALPRPCGPTARRVRKPWSHRRAHWCMPIARAVAFMIRRQPPHRLQMAASGWFSTGGWTTAKSWSSSLASVRMHLIGPTPGWRLKAGPDGQTTPHGTGMASSQSSRGTTSRTSCFWSGTILACGHCRGTGEMTGWLLRALRPSRCSASTVCRVRLTNRKIADQLLQMFHDGRRSFYRGIQRVFRQRSCALMLPAITSASIGPSMICLCGRRRTTSAELAEPGQAQSAC